MSPEPAAPTLASRSDRSSDAGDAARSLVSAVAAQATMTAAARVLAAGLARLVQTPFAVLSRDGAVWQFEAEGFPDAASAGDLTRTPSCHAGQDPVHQWEQDSGFPWTGISLGFSGDRDWLLLAPGTSATWGSRPGFGEMMEQLGGSLGQVASREYDEYIRRFGRRLHAFGHRLAREDDGKLHAIILRTLAAQVRARTGALAVYNEVEHSLAIVATHGYPRALVEHLRIAPGEGIIGKAYQSGQPRVGRSDEEGAPRRLRYRTSSYMVLPIVAGRRRLAVVALTDRADGRDFDDRDFTSARILATTAAPGLTRERVSQNFGELTRMATVDALTGLFNRRYFESRFVAEVERARRQKQDLALLMIDIDDFKRINDTRGHLEGDRTLHDVADLLRQSVRIFDVCARFGGEEFAIIMPGASPAVAMQVAERIRGRVERHFSHDALPVTVSVGVGMLEYERGSHELMEVADDALLAAKAGGKNVVSADGQSRGRGRHL
jgi:diguanylate cyclase (GGDEF)-like protein